MNIACAQKKQKETYDRKHLPDVLAKGTKVLLENTKEKQEGRKIGASMARSIFCEQRHRPAPWVVQLMSLVGSSCSVL